MTYWLNCLSVDWLLIAWLIDWLNIFIGLYYYWYNGCQLPTQLVVLNKYKYRPGTKKSGIHPSKPSFSLHLFSPEKSNSSIPTTLRLETWKSAVYIASLLALRYDALWQGPSLVIRFSTQCIAVHSCYALFVLLFPRKPDFLPWSGASYLQLIKLRHRKWQVHR